MRPRRRRTDAGRVPAPRRLSLVLVIIIACAATFFGSFALIAKSATTSCLRDQSTTEVLRGILIRALDSNQTLYEQGVRDKVVFERFDKDTRIGLMRLKAVSC